MANKKSKEFMYRGFFASFLVMFIFIHNVNFIYLPFGSAFFFLYSYSGVKSEWFFWPVIVRFFMISALSGVVFYSGGGFLSFLCYLVFAVLMLYYSYVAFVELFKKEKYVGENFDDKLDL